MRATICGMWSVAFEYTSGAITPIAAMSSRSAVT
jgi:hypothetical protein